MLSPYRVLDLTDERGLLCGQILADLGADVIAVEPPGGSPARRIGPFAGGVPDPERSLLWWAYARNKRGITLDLDTDDGREKLRQLVVGADFLIESAAPGEMAARGLGYDDLAAVNPALVYISITPFGQTGPKAHYAATDLVVEAAGGNLVLQGDDDRPPVRVSVPQAFLHAGAEAAGAALIASRERLRSGLGQHVDVSAQQAVNQATFGSALGTPVGDPDEITRVAGGVRLGPLTVRLVYPAKDGHVALLLFYGSAVGPFTDRLVRYMFEQRAADEAQRDEDWVSFAGPLLSGDSTAMEKHERLQSSIARFTAPRTKGELLHAALERRLLIAPITTMGDLADSDQLGARGYWQAVKWGPAGRPCRYPGSFAQFGRTPVVYRWPPPALGEHNDEILQGSNRRIAASGRASGESVAPDRMPLSGVKILDFMWAMAGPAATRVFADYGATIVRVESTKRVDTVRTGRFGGWHGGQPGPENSSEFQNLNAGKLGITLDPGSEAGREVILDLVRWADLVTESYSPKAMRAWRLDYDSLRKAKSDIIMLSSCLFGQSGPLSMFAGFGNLSAAISGFYSLTGWPDRTPAGPYLAYTDTVSPRFTVAAILAALEHRDRTGEGQYIDQSQAEASLHFLTPAVLDFEINGREQGRDGNRDPQMAPHGVYPAAGDDRWLAIAVTDDAAWARLCEAIDRTELARDARYATLASRLERHDELDAILCAWTRERDMFEAETVLQAHGVAASAVQNSTELYKDEQLRHRGHFVEVPHEIHGTTTVEGSRARLSRTPARVERSGPTFGRDNMYVLETILGYDAARIAELAAAGVLE